MTWRVGEEVEVNGLSDTRQYTLLLKLSGAIAETFRAIRDDGQSCIVRRYRDKDFWLLEKTALNALQHPRIPRIEQLGIHQGLVLVTNKIVGDNMKEKLYEKERFKPSRIARIGQQLSTILADFHDQGFLYRDVKPENVLLGDDDTVYIVDFNTAHRMTTPWPAGKRVSLGTPEFMSYSTIRGKRPTVQTDIYALGITLWELTGTPTFMHQVEIGWKTRREKSFSFRDDMLRIAQVQRATEKIIEPRCIDTIPRLGAIIATCLKGGYNTMRHVAQALKNAEPYLSLEERTSLRVT